MNSLQKLQKILGQGFYSCGAHCWRVNGVLISYWHLHNPGMWQPHVGNCVKIYYKWRQKRISVDHFPFVGEACIDAIQNLKMFGHEL